jgi:uncharacterized protein (TIGR03086 family)
MDILELLGSGFAWTADRIRLVRPDDMAVATPCTRWNLRQLLNHTVGAIDVVASALAGNHVLTESGAHELAGQERIGNDPAAAYAEMTRWALKIWHEPGALDRDCPTERGPIQARDAIAVTLMETVVHGWDIGQSTGEDEPIPPYLAGPILEFARRWPHVDGQRGAMYDPAIPGGITPSGRLLGFLGRRPLAASR